MYLLSNYFHTSKWTVRAVARKLHSDVQHTFAADNWVELTINTNNLRCTAPLVHNIIHYKSSSLVVIVVLRQLRAFYFTSPFKRVQKSIWVVWWPLNPPFPKICQIARQDSRTQFYDPITLLISTILQALVHTIKPSSDFALSLPVHYGAEKRRDRPGRE